MRSRWFGAVAACLVLAGCSGGSGYATQTAESLQSHVLAIASLASTRDYAAALLQLTQLEQADNAALSAGSITRSRHDAILATIGQVRADLTSLQAAAQPVVHPTPQPAIPPAPQPKQHKKDGGDGNGNGNGGD